MSRLLFLSKGEKMKKYMITLYLLIVISSFVNAAEEKDYKFFKAPPSIPGAEEVSEIDGKQQYNTKMSHDDLLAFYKKEFKDSEDIKYRDWADATYIEDDGAREWHSITISKDNENATVIVATDNWTWIIGTLILRYIGVFIVLLVLYAGMQISGKIISSSVKKAAAK